MDSEMTQMLAGRWIGMISLAVVLLLAVLEMALPRKRYERKIARPALLVATSQDSLMAIKTFTLPEGLFSASVFQWWLEKAGDEMVGVRKDPDWTPFACFLKQNGFEARVETRYTVFYLLPDTQDIQQQYANPAWLQCFQAGVDTGVCESDGRGEITGEAALEALWEIQGQLLFAEQDPEPQPEKGASADDPLPHADA